jgi:hypothetical protein
MRRWRSGYVQSQLSQRWLKKRGVIDVNFKETWIVRNSSFHHRQAVEVLDKAGSIDKRGFVDPAIFLSTEENRGKRYETDLETKRTDGRCAIRIQTRGDSKFESPVFFFVMIGAFVTRGIRPGH